MVRHNVLTLKNMKALSWIPALSRIRAVASTVPGVSTPLSNRQQALIFATGGLAILSLYIGLGAPTDKASLLGFGTGAIVILTNVVKELAG